MTVDGRGRHPFGDGGGDLGAWGSAGQASGGSRNAERPDDDDSLAPVIPLFGTTGAASSFAHPSRGNELGSIDRGHESHDATSEDERIRPRLRAIRDDVTEPGGEGVPTPDVDEIRERAEAVLLRRLRSRSLSLSEARSVVRAVEGADEVMAEELVDRFVDLGYLDDATFAEQLVMSAIEKRGEGRRAVAETLRKRGIPRDVADAALAELPDDDAERALEFARSKVRGVEGKDHDAALRRLAGQLARRGYPSSVSLSAARAALEEAGIGRSRSFSRTSPSSGVRFTPDE